MKHDNVTSTYGITNERLSDFLKVCPYSLTELRSKSRKMPLADWRKMYLYFLYFETPNVRKAGEIANVYNDYLCQAFDSLTFNKHIHRDRFEQVKRHKKMMEKLNEIVKM